MNRDSTEQGLTFPTNVSFEVKWEPNEDTLDVLHRAFGYEPDQGLRVAYKTGTLWFHPTVVLNQAHIVDFLTSEGEFESICQIHMHAPSSEVVWPGRFGQKPAYWLWRRWGKTRNWVSDLLRGKR
jgi:hypothetical protein